jgi:hypothetical protein
MNGSRGSNFLQHLRSERNGSYFQTDFFLRGCSLGHGLVMASDRMRGKRIFSCFLLSVSYCRPHKGGKD